MPDPSPTDAAIMRRDLEQSLRRRSIHPLTLSALQRILLTTDGTVTDILEAFAGESIRVTKLAQETVLTDHAIAALRLPWGERILRRRILLQGRISLVNLIFAESVIALDHLPDGVRTGLLESGKGIGQLFLEHRIESFREILDCGREPARELAGHFGIDENASLLFRTYSISSHGKPVIVITEKFPELYFREWEPTSKGTGVPLAVGSEGAKQAKTSGAYARPNIVAELEQFLRRGLLRGREPEELSESTDLLSEGLAEPQNLFPLIEFISERFAVEFQENELVAENFRQVGIIADRILGARSRRAVT